MRVMPVLFVFGKVNGLYFLRRQPATNIPLPDKSFGQMNFDASKFSCTNGSNSAANFELKSATTSVVSERVRVQTA